MKFLSAALAAAIFSTSVVAAPVISDGVSLEERNPIDGCRPRLNGKTEKVFEVDVTTAQAQAKKAGRTTGKSGDPRRYHNGDHINFGIHNCDKSDAILWEYPIYWVGKNAEWEKDVKTGKQKGGATPTRVVYANSNGGI